MVENIAQIEDYFSGKSILSEIIEKSNPLNIIKKLNSSEFETLEIIFNADIFETLLQSLEEARFGKIITISEAFSDLD